MELWLAIIIGALLFFLFLSIVVENAVAAGTLKALIAFEKLKKNPETFDTMAKRSNPWRD